MKLRLITENDYDGLEDADEFRTPASGPIPPELEKFIYDGNLDSGNLTPDMGVNSGPHFGRANPSKYLQGIKGQGRFIFPVMTEHRPYVETNIEDLHAGIHQEFYWALHDAIINAVLRKHGLDEYMEANWRMPMRVLNWGFAKSDPLVYVDISFDSGGYLAGLFFP
jgi:hypothetical protein